MKPCWSSEYSISEQLRARYEIHHTKLHGSRWSKRFVESADRWDAQLVVAEDQRNDHLGLVFPSCVRTPPERFGSLSTMGISCPFERERERPVTVSALSDDKPRNTPTTWPVVVVCRLGCCSWKTPKEDSSPFFLILCSVPLVSRNKTRSIDRDAMTVANWGWIRHRSAAFWCKGKIFLKIRRINAYLNSR